jgi:hypothetical protein
VFSDPSHHLSSLHQISFHCLFRVNTHILFSALVEILSSLPPIYWNDISNNCIHLHELTHCASGVEVMAACPGPTIYLAENPCSDPLCARQKKAFFSANFAGSDKTSRCLSDNGSEKPSQARNRWRGESGSDRGLAHDIYVSSRTNFVLPCSFCFHIEKSLNFQPWSYRVIHPSRNRTQEITIWWKYWLNFFGYSYQLVQLFRLTLTL